MSKLYRPPHKRPKRHSMRRRPHLVSEADKQFLLRRRLANTLADNNLLSIPMSVALVEGVSKLLGHPKIELGPGEEHDD